MHSIFSASSIKDTMIRQSIYLCFDVCRLRFVVELKLFIEVIDAYYKNIVPIKKLNKSFTTFNSGTNRRSEILNLYSDSRSYSSSSLGQRHRRKRST